VFSALEPELPTTNPQFAPSLSSQKINGAPNLSWAMHACFRGHNVAVADFVSGTIKNRPKPGHNPRIPSPCLRRWKAHGLLVSAGADILRSAQRKQCAVRELKVNYRWFGK
jgi:hypothetical protein